MVLCLDDVLARIANFGLNHLCDSNRKNGEHACGDATPYFERPSSTWTAKSGSGAFMLDDYSAACCTCASEMRH